MTAPDFRYPGGYPYGAVDLSPRVIRIRYAASCPGCGAECEFESVGRTGALNGEFRESTRLEEVLVHCPACDEGDATV